MFYLNERAVDEPLEVVQAHHVMVHVPPHLTHVRRKSIIIRTVTSTGHKRSSTIKIRIIPPVMRQAVHGCELDEGHVTRYQYKSRGK
jgi:hypothetical protein